VDNKRNFYRVQITIGMRLVMLGTKMPIASAESHFRTSDSSKLKQKLQRLRHTVNEQLRQFPAELDAVSMALHGLQQQIDAIAVSLCKSSEDFHAIRVSLSEGGLGWRQREALSPGEYVALALELDNLISHCVYAKVVSCKIEKDHHLIGVEFKNIDEAVLQNIAKFVLQADAEQRRLRRTLS
jgi:hypothetical protein